MMKQIVVLAILAIFILSSCSAAVRTFSGTNIYIDAPVDDDVFAWGSVINVDAPVSSATIFGGTINVNAPVAGDLIVAGGQVTVNAHIGGKVIAAGGNINIGGNITKNALLAGGQVDIRPGALIGKDAFISAGTVNNAGRVEENLTVSASNFENTGSAGRVEFHQIKKEHEQPEYPVSPFGILMALGYLIAGLIFLRFFPAMFSIVDMEVKKSTALKTISGFVLMIVAIVLILLATVTIIGIPLAIIMMLLFVLAMMLSGIFVSFSLGRAIFDLLKFKSGDWVVFVIGFVILNGAFYIPLAGGLIKLVAISLGLGAILFAIRTNWAALSRPV